MFPVIRIASLTIQARGLILLAAFWVASWAAERAAKRLALRGDDVYNLGFYGVVAGLLGARLGYVLQYWSVYQNDLGAIFALNFNTLSPAAGLLADLASGDGYGAPAQLPWSINLWGELRHPTQIYHLLAAIGIGVVLWRSSHLFDGARFGLFIALYTASRLFLETFHGDSATFAGVRVVQIWSLAALVVALLLLRRWAETWARDVQPVHETT